MSWPRLEAIKERLSKRWEKGQLLRDLLDPASAYPLRLPLKPPTAQALNDNFAAARAWVQHWQQVAARQPSVELEWRDINHRQLGRHALPAAVQLATPDAALALIGKKREAARFMALYRQFTAAQPALGAWCAHKPHALLAHAEHGERLLAVLAWVKANPRPGIYLRQLEIPGVDSKFIEAHRGLLGELLDHVLPESAIDTRYRGAREFEPRYGFLTRPARVRFRLLDRRHAIAGLSDIEIPVAAFNQLGLHPLARDLERVYIVENAITALAFPPRNNAMVIFGQGYGVDQLLGRAGWLQDRPLFYWGDIDTHGFAILDQLRSVLPHAHSLLMDRATLEAHQTLWGHEPSPTSRVLTCLTAHEQAVYQLLVDNTLGKQLRLEQERIAFDKLCV